MFRSDYSGYESVGTSDHSSFSHDTQLSHSTTASADHTGITPNLSGTSRNFSSLFSPDLSPNKRAIMEAMLTHWIDNPPKNQVSKPVISPQRHSVSTSPSIPSSTASSHFTERRAS